MSEIKVGFLSSSQTKYCASLTTQKYFYTSFSVGSGCQTCMCKRGISSMERYERMERGGNEFFNFTIRNYYFESKVLKQIQDII